MSASGPVAILFFQRVFTALFILTTMEDLSQQKKRSLHDFLIRPIEERDNQAMASVIRTTLEEFGANHPGTVYYDATTDRLFQLFQQTPRSAYFVAEQEGELVGGGGIFPTEGLPGDTAELVKMYLLKKARGVGLGKMLIQKALDFAKAAGYRNVYLETMPELQQALHTYAKFGFAYLDHPMGNSGHFGCALWMLKPI
jgi:putative acetyltransferase